MFQHVFIKIKQLISRACTGVITLFAVMSFPIFCVYTLSDIFFLIVIPNQFLTIELIKQQVGYLDEQEGITFLTEIDDYSQLKKLTGKKITFSAFDCLKFIVAIQNIYLFCIICCIKCQTQSHMHAQQFLFQNVEGDAVYRNYFLNFILKVTFHNNF